MMDITTDKADLRKVALALRGGAGAEAHAAAGGNLSAVLAGYRGVPLAGYMPMRGEADPIAAMSEAAAHGPVGVPVIKAKATPLQFRTWSPDAKMVPGMFGAEIPETGDWITPQIVIVPLVGFDMDGGRLGYGGGFYDRTLEKLRAAGPVLAIGFALSVQEFDDLPQEETDQPLDMIVTDQGVFDLG